LSTAQLDRPAPVLSRVTQLRHTSPGRLQLILACLLALGLLTGVVAGLAANSAGAGTDDLGGRAQPLLVEAETIYSALADADTTAAQAFLTGGIEPPGLTARYDDDLNRATAALTSAARRTSDSGATADAVRALSSGVPQYAALVATARANNRQGLPVGASYLSAASTLNRGTLLPQADALFTAAQRDVQDGYANSRSTIWVSLLVLLILALLVGLVYAQRYLSRHTHRTFNVPLVAATLVIVVMALTTFGFFAAQRSHLRTADKDGSAPVAVLADLRILALNERGDEALTLVARGGSDANEADFKKAAAAFGQEVGAQEDGSLRTQHEAYVKAHQDVRKLDDGGDYDGAVALAIGSKTTKTFTDLTDATGAALEDHKSTFTAQIGSAGRGLGLLTVLGPLLALIACGLAFAGIRARLEEYR
jgi:hypothetical protein